MKFASGWQPTEWNLHPAGGQLNEICIPLAASWMKFASGWRPTGCKFGKNMQIAHCLAASVLQACWDYIFINYNLYRWNINIKTNCGSQTDKALSNHESFSPSQCHETVPLNCYELLRHKRWAQDVTHRWAHLLKQQSSFAVYRLPTKENKLPFSVYVDSKQMKVCCFCFPFVVNKGNFLFHHCLFN